MPDVVCADVDGWENEGVNNSHTFEIVWVWLLGVRHGAVGESDCRAGAYHNARLALKSRQHAGLQVYQKRQKAPTLSARPHTVGVLRPIGADHTAAGDDGRETAPAGCTTPVET